MTEPETPASAEKNTISAAPASSVARLPRRLDTHPVTSIIDEVTKK